MRECRAIYAIRVAHRKRLISLHGESLAFTLIFQKQYLFVLAGEYLFPGIRSHDGRSLPRRARELLQVGMFCCSYELERETGDDAQRCHRRISQSIRS